MIPGLIALLSPLVGKVIDRIPNSHEREKAKLQFEVELAKIDQTILTSLVEIDKAQAAINVEEAKHSNIFVAGWRPFIGWVCGAGFAWLVLAQPVLVFAFAASGHSVKDLPVLDSSMIMAMCSGMLGLGGLRSFEKYKGVAK